MTTYQIFMIGIYFFMFILLYVKGNSDCNLISTKRHQISSKDFKVTRYDDQKYVMCAAYYCSRLPVVLPLELTVHGINSTKDNLAVYLEQKSETFRKRCGYCQKNSTETEKDAKDTNCVQCRKLEPSKGIEIHVRLDKPSGFNASSTDCVWNINFNMSIQEFTCKEGLTVNVPVNNHCNVSQTSNFELMCIKPTCSEDMKSHPKNESFIHKFIESKTPVSCVWNISVDLLSTLEISFSPSIKKYLTLYEENLLTPKWHLIDCIDHSSHLTIKPNSKNVFLLYRNNESLSSDAFLEVNISKTVCPLASKIDNGEVKIHTYVNGSYAHYTCLENYYLVGDQHIHCDKISQPPICINEKEKYMLSDGPKSSTNESVPNAYHPNVVQDNLNLSVVPPREIPSAILDQVKSSPLPKGKLVSEEPEVTRSNVSLIELDQGNLDATKLPLVHDPSSSPSPVEGSGQSRLSEDGDTYPSLSDTESGTEEMSPSGADSDEETSSTNGSFSLNSPINKNFNHTSITPPWQSDDNIVLFSLTALEDKMMLFIIVGVAILLIVIITVISLIVCRNRSIRSGLNRKFDTFQNPIYEKPVVRVPIPSNDSDPGQEKLDLGDLSDSTVLD